jgi:hypothetical protein
MTPALSVSLIWLLAMLAAAAHMAPARLAPAELARAVIAFALIFWVVPYLSPQPNWVGVLVGVAAFWRLIAGPMPRIGPVLAGSCAALAAALQVAGGIPYWLAAALGFAALLVAGLVLGRVPIRRIAFREHVLIVSALGAPTIGLAGDVAYGWHSAAVLNRAAAPLASVSPPIWAIIILVLAVVAGAVRGLWIRR